MYNLTATKIREGISRGIMNKKIFIICFSCFLRFKITCLVSIILLENKLILCNSFISLIEKRIGHKA